MRRRDKRQMGPPIGLVEHKARSGLEGRAREPVIQRLVTDEFGHGRPLRVKAIRKAQAGLRAIQLSAFGILRYGPRQGECNHLMPEGEPHDLDR